VVDDEEDMRLLLKDLLVPIGFEVDVASDGAVALQRIEAAPPDLVLLDLMMPVLDGWTVLERLRGRAGAPPVIVLSGVGDHASLHSTLTQGAVAAIAKPFEWRALREACLEAVGRPGGPPAASSSSSGPRRP
jgi:DNA-binding response OmpR family regulator